MVRTSETTVDLGGTCSSGVDKLLRARRASVITILLATSLLIRGAYLLEMAGGPCVWLHRWGESDMHHYDAWARQIAAGDWLSRDVSPPLHYAQRAIAREFIELHPQRAAELGALSAGVNEGDAARYLWKHWCGEPRFYQDPLYPYLIAATYLMFGPDARVVAAWQSSVGVLVNVLIWAIARRAFGELAGVVAAGLALLCGPLLADDVLLLRTGVVTLAGLMVTWLAMRAHDARSWAAWAITGAAAGVAICAQSQYILLAIGIGVVAALAGRGRRTGDRPAARSWVATGELRVTERVVGPRPSRGAAGTGESGATVRAAAFAAGLALGLAPLAVRNVAVGLAPCANAGGGAITFLLASAADAGPGQWGMGHAADVLYRSDGRLIATVGETLATHAGVGSVAALLGGKLLALIHDYEIPNNANYYYLALHSDVLRWLPVSFGLIAPLAAVGLLAGGRQLRRVSPLYLLVGVQVLALLMFFVYGRFRVPLLAALIPFAGLAVASGAAWITERRWGRLAGAGALAAVIGLLAFDPGLYPRPLVRAADVIVAYQVYYDPLAELALQRGDVRRAADILAESLGHQPGFVRRIGPGRPAGSAAEAEIAEVHAEVYQRCAELFAALGEQRASAEHTRRAAELRAGAGGG
jgi:hypothetical protein